ncbi:MAG: nucleotidyltransferase family protein [Clostridiales bacterium]|nr:nucleotidyltransferase family protein [Clostridiales bacterium]
MTLEMQWMVKLLDAYINKTDITLPPSCSAEKLYEAGKKHSVLPILFQVLCRQGSDCKDNSGEVMELFKKAYISAVYLASLQDCSLEELGEKLTERGIGYVPVKGSVIKKLYPEPDLRTMGDLDLLIQEKDRAAADEIMKSLGYERQGLGSNVWTYKRGMVTFEIHVNLAGEKYWNDVDYIAYFSELFQKSHPIGEKTERCLTLEDHFLFLCFHLAKHLCSTGAGIRMILDIALYIKHYDKQMDWQYIWEEADKLQLRDFIENMLFICRSWFHVETAVSAERMDSRTQAIFEEYVLSGGVFGFEREDSIRRLRKGIREEGSNRSLWVKLRALLYLAFPDREHMKDFLPELEDHPALLPAAWVKRWYLGLRNKERVKKSLESFSGNVEEAKSQWELLKKIGL